ncbi:hypothetical protein PAXRUDRAFT_437514 [Paxillus rubicundulus Ve08.2h10]|uniref:Uncharacterized protein n=1 Tax=Paxillus rubicundulus Ve08.2h10 TaxID=930991 RepID=A0A0D0DX68_9AGAM|nr:hypothetical protein PAXRUDRAFT_437514 [Paxillus rubicundulus Ve08.2h10]
MNEMVPHRWAGLVCVEGDTLPTSFKWYEISTGEKFVFFLRHGGSDYPPQHNCVQSSPMCRPSICHEHSRLVSLQMKTVFSNQCLPFANDP